MLLKSAQGQISDDGPKGSKQPTNVVLPILWVPQLLNQALY